MILGWIFDLDGTLVQTERLKAKSYARAVQELCPGSVTQDEVLERYKRVVGRSRQEMAQALVHAFDLEQAANARRQDFGVQTAWQALLQIRLRYYQEMLQNPKILYQNQWPHAVALLRSARAADCATALVTMSTCASAGRVLDVLGLRDQFDFVATRDDVEKGKPDPEIYHLALSQLDLPAKACLAIEDSPSGVAAALAAGVYVVAVATPFTRDGLHAIGGNQGSYRVVDPPEGLQVAIQDVLQELDSRR